ncbi:MAG: T9SS type A sorting domain-containing protein [Candidatus Eisenbacteria bacterium]|uniref:T9SS type A sorting domain-containing protein n=1 Tax=Eiseniibacteriota bacterium TaxID=2212470 RepID=A0A933SE61_UNCEI|nr:T9SS type A sorting domain-containing protein [Candidatus Eisenbacteria bacterium]
MLGRARPLLATVFAVSFAVLSSLSPAKAGAATFSAADSCTDCIAVPDPCCSALPNYQFPNAPVFSPNILVATRQAIFNPWVVTIYDMASPLPPGPEDVNWAAITRYNGPGVGWTVDSLGTVFGLTLDEYGNIFVCHTAIYGGDAVGQVFGGGPGAVYRIDGVTGKITTFVKLPNFPDTSQPTGEDLPGLGNITYDCAHKQFFVTNMENGKIYRIKPTGVNGPTGTVVQVFDPMTPDAPSPGWAPLCERLWAVQIHGNRVFYSVWAEDGSNTSALSNTIRSVGLDGAGAILPLTDKLELVMPDNLGLGSQAFYGANPVSDISFNAAGDMLLAERSMGGPTYSGAHLSRLLEYRCTEFCWRRTNAFDVGDCCARTNSAGGCDYDRMPYTGSSQALGRTWASGDALHLSGSYPDIIYGLQGFRPNGGNITTSILIDSDGDTLGMDKVFQGDVEKPGCPPPTVGKLCGTKWSDLDHDGVHDGNESGVGGWTITLSGPGGPYTVTTGPDGSWCVDDLPPGTYTVTEGMLPNWVPTFPPGGSHTTTLAVGQTIGGLDFGNYACTGGGPCASIPKGMSAWWTFDEPAGTTGALDLVHADGARNALQLSGATIVPDGAVGGALAFATAADHATIPAASASGLDIGMRSFSFDAWLRLDGAVAGARTIAEKRSGAGGGAGGAGGMLGWALYVEGGHLMLEVGGGGAPVVCAGPPVSVDTWTHFAVTFDRATGAGAWYIDGSSQPAYAFTLPALDATNNAEVSFGQASASFGGGRALIGVLDEVEFFPNTAMSAATVQSVWAAGPRGKCRDLLRLPAVTTICKDDTTVTVCFSVTNTSGGPKSYHWSVAGLPVGPGCTVAGPVSFTPSSGSFTVPAVSSGVPVCITIKRPAGLTAQNATSCFSLTLLNDSTGVCQTRTSSIRADNTCWCVKANTSGVVNVAARVLPPGIAGTPIVIGTGFPCDPLGRVLQLRAYAKFTDANGDPEAARISINGLPPGEPVLADVVPGGTGGEQATTFFVAWRGEHDLALACDLVIEADTDGDGMFEEMCSVPMRSVWDGDQVAAVTPGTGGGALVAQLRATPNPSFGPARVSFTLPAPGQVTLGVYDVNGRLVRTLQRGTMSAGAHALDWDGRDPSGAHVPAGVYFVRLELPGQSLRSKLVKLR